MIYLVSHKAVRLFLAVSVSVWLAGGCLFGCGGSAMASTGPADEAAAVEGRVGEDRRGDDQR